METSKLLRAAADAGIAFPMSHLLRVAADEIDFHIARISELQKEIERYEAANLDLQLHFDSLKEDYDIALDKFKTAEKGLADIEDRCFNGDHVCAVPKLVANLMKDIK